MKWIALLLFGSVGACALTAGIVWGAKRYKLMKAGVKTTGTIVDAEASTSTDSKGNRSTSYFPMVEFTARDGSKRKFRGSTGGGESEYPKGSKVELVYNPANPDNAQIADFEQFWLGPAAIGLFGFLFLVGGIGGFFLIQDSDKTFGPAFEAKMARTDLMDGRRGIKLKATVKTVSQRKEGYVLVCSGGMPGGTPRDFDSGPLGFDPGTGVLGKPVDVYADPDDAARYYVHVEPLFGQAAPGSGSF